MSAEQLAVQAWERAEAFLFGHAIAEAVEA